MNWPEAFVIAVAIICLMLTVTFFISVVAKGDRESHR